MKFIIATCLILGLTTVSAGASIFDTLRDSAPRSVFDDLRDSAPKSIWDQLNQSAPKSDDVWSSLQKTAP